MKIFKLKYISVEGCTKNAQRHRQLRLVNEAQ
jgi:hypothetical protein